MPAPKRLARAAVDEVDDAGFGDETRYLFEEISDNGDISQPKDDDPSLRPEEGRLRLRPDIVLEGKKYAGEKSSRKEIFPEEEDRDALRFSNSKGARKRRHASLSHSDSESNYEGSEEEYDKGDGGAESAEENDEIESLAREYSELREQEDNWMARFNDERVEVMNKHHLKSLKGQGEEDYQKGQAVRNQKTLWDKSLEMRIGLQKIFSACNQLPQEPVRSHFFKVDDKIEKAYSELIDSTKDTVNTLLELQEVLNERNSNIVGSLQNDCKKANSKGGAEDVPSSERDRVWESINTAFMRTVPFRNNSVDKWHRKTQLSTGSIATKSKLHAFNQSISHQVSKYMRDPSSMIKRMQLMRSSVHVLGTDDEAPVNGELGTSENSLKDMNIDGDPELLDDMEFYQQLLQEFLETTDPTSLGTNVYALRKMRNRKRKVVDRRASKSRKIRYHVHEKIVNFMAPEPVALPPMAPKLFSNLFGLQNLQET